MADLIVKVCHSTSKLEKPTPIPTNIHQHFPFHRIHTAEEADYEDYYEEPNSIALERLHSVKSFKTEKSESKNLETFKSITELGEGQLAVKMKQEVHMFVEQRDSRNSQQKSVEGFKTGRKAERDWSGDSSEESDDGGLDGEARDLDKEEYRVNRTGLEDGMGVTTTVTAHE